MTELAKILIVDDNPKYLEDALLMYGYEVIVAKDGVQALKVLGKEYRSISLILLDVMMPNMNGWDTLKAIRTGEKTKTMPVIMITAVNEEQKMVSGLKIGADDYIVKPFVLPNLLARIEAVLRRSNWNKNNQKSASVAFSSVEPTEMLTNKQRAVLALAAQGASNSEISQKLCLKESTVKVHMYRILKKLKVSSRTQAVLLGMQMNLLDE